MINKTPKNKKIKLYGTVENINGMFSNYFSFIVTGVSGVSEVIPSKDINFITYQKHKLKPKNKL